MKTIPKRYKYGEVKKGLAQGKSYVSKKTSKNSKIPIGTKSPSLDFNLIPEFMPVNQRLHVGHMFFLLMYDLYGQYLKLNNNSFQSKIFFDFSPYVYQMIGHEKININQVLKQKKRNAKKIEQLYIQQTADTKDFSLIEKNLRAARELFTDLFKKGYIKSRATITYWSPQFASYVDDASIYFQGQQKTRYFIKYFIDRKGKSIVVSTDTIETIFADVALAVHPKDKRYKKLIGKGVLIPIVNRVIPIIGDEGVDFQDDEFSVVRITPGHDKFSLDIAERHGLDTSLLAIDKNGYFTDICGEFSGKSLEEFEDNVIKFVDDIGNMENTESFLGKNAFCSYSGQKLIPLQEQVFSFIFPLQTQKPGETTLPCDVDIHSPSQVGGVEISKDDVDTDDMIRFHVSTASPYGSLLPVFTNIKGEFEVLSDSVFLVAYQKAKTKRHIILSILISNLILDGVLDLDFSLENLIGAYLSYAWTEGQRKGEIYMDLFKSSIGSKRQLAKEIKELEDVFEKIKEDEQHLRALEKLLLNSFAILYDKKNFRYFLDMRKVFGGSKKRGLQKINYFNNAFFTFSFMLHSFKDDGVASLPQFSLGLAKNRKHVDNFLCLAQLQGIDISDHSFVPLPYLKKTEKEIFRFDNSKLANLHVVTILKNFDADMLRLLMYDTPGTFNFDANKLEQFDLWMNKLWNAYRYIYHRVWDNLETQDIKKIYTYVGKNTQDLSDFDIWFLDSFKEFIDTLHIDNPKEGLFSNLERIIRFSEELFDMYMEISKVESSSLSPYMMSIFAYIYLKLLRMYIPIFADKVHKLFGRGTDYQKFLSLPDYVADMKNYQLNVFIDIVRKTRSCRKQLNLAKHETTDVFIQATADILNFCKDHDHIIKTLTNSEEVGYFVMGESVKKGYTVQNIIDIQVGVKKTGKEVSKLHQILALKKDIQRQQEEIQRKKILLSKIAVNLSTEDVQSRKDEITTLGKQLLKMKKKFAELK